MRFSLCIYIFSKNDQKKKENSKAVKSHEFPLCIDIFSKNNQKKKCNTN